MPMEGWKNCLEQKIKIYAENEAITLQSHAIPNVRCHDGHYTRTCYDEQVSAGKKNTQCSICGKAEQVEQFFIKIKEKQLKQHLNSLVYVVKVLQLYILNEHIYILSILFKGLLN